MEYFILGSIFIIAMGLISFERRVIKQLDALEEKINDLQHTLDNR